jgi:hypothetical protein
MVNDAHHTPTTNNTVRIGMVDVELDPAGWTLE